MHILVALDDKDGMLFNRRRQSRDAALCARIVSLTAGQTLWVHPYSVPLFPADTVRVDERFLQKAQLGEYAFVENVPLPPAAEIEQIMIYRWHRVYPADVRFPAALLHGRRLIAATNFAGNSHETITEEVYR